MHFIKKLQYHKISSRICEIIVHIYYNLKSIHVVRLKYLGNHVKILHFVKSKFPVLYDEILKDVNTIYDHIILFVELDMLT